MTIVIFANKSKIVQFLYSTTKLAHIIAKLALIVDDLLLESGLTCKKIGKI